MPTSFIHKYAVCGNVIYNHLTAFLWSASLGPADGSSALTLIANSCIWLGLKLLSCRHGLLISSRWQSCSFTIQSNLLPTTVLTQLQGWLQVLLGDWVPSTRPRLNNHVECFHTMSPGICPVQPSADKGPTGHWMQHPTVPQGEWLQLLHSWAQLPRHLSQLFTPFSL